MEMVLEILKTATRNIDILTEKFILIKYVTQRPEVSKSIQAYRTTTYFTFFRIIYNTQSTLTSVRVCCI